MFSVYLQLGFSHLLDLKAYDHILFIVALTVIYRTQEWRKLLVLVTAFTIGHSLTLALSVLDIIDIKPTVVEWLIPVTILLTCFSNLYQNRNRLLNPDYSFYNRSMHRNYYLALFFGLIHGLGFSNFLKSALMPGEEDQLIWQLLAFNLGLELAQLLVVGMMISVGWLVLNVLGVSRTLWVKSISVLVMLLTFWVMYDLL